MGKPMEFSAAEQKVAEEQVGRQVVACPQNYYGRVHALKYVATDLQCQLNAAVELLRGLLECHCCDDGSVDYDGTATDCEECRPVRDFLSHFPEGAKQ